MQDFLARARKASASSSTVLILGETGIGKDVIARYIQSTGPRADKVYLTMNCAAVPEGQFESELFGHARGAFPGAHTWKSGLFEEAHGGTLFLDEIGSMALPAQTNLLRVLEEGAVRRLGEKRPIKVDVRLIVATNRDLDSLIASGEFREDLYYRLSVVTLVVPPLRKRPEDIEPLARLFLAESVRRHRKLRVFAPGTLELLRSYAYPGNIRELRYAIEHAAILSEDGVLRPEDFPFAGARAEASGASAAPARRIRTRPIAQEITPERLQQVLQEQGGNRVRTARALPDQPGNPLPAARPCGGGDGGLESTSRSGPRLAAGITPENRRGPGGIRTFLVRVGIAALVSSRAVNQRASGILELTILTNDWKTRGKTSIVRRRLTTVWRADPSARPSRDSPRSASFRRGGGGRWRGLGPSADGNSQRPSRRVARRRTRSARPSCRAQAAATNTGTAGGFRVRRG